MVNRKILSLILVLAFIVLLSGVVSATTQTEYMSYLERTGSIQLDYIKLTKNNDYLYDNFENGLNLTNYSNKGSAFITISNSTIEKVTGTSSLKIIYNVTTGSAWFRINITKVPQVYNYSGIGFWFKGDGSNNSLNWVYANNSSTTFSGNSVYIKNFNISFNEWRYIYLDFHYFVSLNSSSNDFNTPLYIQINIDNSTYKNNVTGTVYIDDISFLDNLQGAMGWDYPNKNTSRWGYIESGESRNTWRYMDGIYLQSWLYKNATNNSFRNNLSILNYTILSGDMLVRTQDPRGVWIEGQGENGLGFWIENSPCLSLGLSYNLIKNEDRMNENIVLNSWFNNNTNNNKTRSNHWIDTIRHCADNIVNTELPNTYNSSGQFVSNQYFISLLTEYITYNITGNITYLNNYHNKLYNLSIMQDMFGVHQEKNDNNDVNPAYDNGYGAIQNNIMTLGYLITRNNSFITGLNKSENVILNMIGSNKKLLYANSSRRTSGDYYAIDSMMSYAVHKIAKDNGFKYLSQSSFYSINTYENQFQNLTSNITTYGYLFPWGFFLPFSYDYYSEKVNNSFVFPMEYNNFTYDLMNNSNIKNRRIFNKQFFDSNLTRNVDEFPRMLFAYDSNSSWWIRGDYLDSNSTGFSYSDENGNFTLAIVPQARLDESIKGLTMFTESDGNNNINSTRNQNQIWFSSSSSTSKHIASNLSQTISGVSVIVDVDSCDTVGTITYTPDSGANVQIFTVGSYSCTNNQATLTLNNIEPAQNSNILNIEYNAASQTSCNNTIVALLGFPALIGLVGSVILIGLIIMLLTGYAKRDGGGELFSKENLIIGFVALILIGVLVIIGVLVVSTLCGGL